MFYVVDLIWFDLYDLIYLTWFVWFDLFYDNDWFVIGILSFGSRFIDLSILRVWNFSNWKSRVHHILFGEKHVSKSRITINRFKRKLSWSLKGEYRQKEQCGSRTKKIGCSERDNTCHPTPECCRLTPRSGERCGWSGSRERNYYVMLYDLLDLMYRMYLPCAEQSPISKHEMCVEPSGKLDPVYQVDTSAHLSTVYPVYPVD